MNDRKVQIISTLYLILSGILIAFLANLLVYFKQKESLHLLIILLLTVMVFISSKWMNGKLHVSSTLKTVAIAAILMIAWLGPQLIYQVRPRTFYITGIALALILVVATSTGITYSWKNPGFLWKIGTYLSAFTLAYFAPWIYLQYISMAISAILVGLFLLDSTNRSRFAILFLLLITAIAYWQLNRPLKYYQEQVQYEDKVLFAANTQFHKLVVTQWQDDYWIFKDKLKDISSIDDFLFYEPMAHSVFRVGEDIRDVLMVGGENGCLLKEVLKYKSIDQLDVISYDTLFRNIGRSEDFFIKMNRGAYEHKKTNIIRKDLISFLSETDHRYDAIFIDLPDPRSIETNQYYTREFYEMIHRLLGENGIMITQAGSPYFATAAFLSIGQTIEDVGFHILPLHNQILTLGEWGWYLASPSLSAKLMKNRLVSGQNEVETAWFDSDAAKMISSFGKIQGDSTAPGINTLDNPLVYQYYLKGNWILN